MAFGLAYDTKNNQWYLGDEKVRFLWGILTSNGEEPTGGNFHGTIRSLESQTGTIDIYTIRDFANPDAAGNGTLTGIGKFSQAEFDQRTQAAKEPQTSSGSCTVTQDEKDCAGRQRSRKAKYSAPFLEQKGVYVLK